MKYSKTIMMKVLLTKNKYSCYSIVKQTKN